LLAVAYPGTQTLNPAALDLARFYRTVGMAIHAVDPSLLLIYEDKRLGGSGAPMALTGSADLPNGVYSVHMYPQAWATPAGQPILHAYETRAAAWGAPLW